MKARVLLIGDEILGGVISDRNTATIARTLADVGVPVDRSETVGDELAEIQAGALRLLGAEHVFVTGGLGPTADDLTRDAFAALLGVDLVRDEGGVRRLHEIAELLRFPPPTEMVLRQAEVPRGATVVRNPTGSALGFRAEHEGTTFWVLPGVPSEVEAMMDEVVAVLARGDVQWQRTVATCGRGEVVVAERIADFIPPPELKLAYLPNPGGVRLRLFAPGGVAAGVLDAAEADLRGRLGDWALPEASIQASLVRRAAEADERFAVAESCTGGLIGSRITDVPGASRVYLGGVVAYANEIKTQALGVSEELLAAQGAVSGPVAEAMAVGVRERFAATRAVSVTGIAGPGGGTPEKPVGTVWVGYADPGGSGAEPFHFRGRRATVRERTVNKALEIAYRRLIDAS